jgi:hypothetical protein
MTAMLIHSVQVDPSAVSRPLRGTSLSLSSIIYLTPFASQPGEQAFVTSSQYDSQISYWSIATPSAPVLHLQGHKGEHPLYHIYISLTTAEPVKVFQWWPQEEKREQHDLLSLSADGELRLWHIPPLPKVLPPFYCSCVTITLSGTRATISRDSRYILSLPPFFSSNSWNLTARKKLPQKR